MHFTTNAMPCQLAYNRVSTVLAKVLNCESNMTDAISGLCLLYANQKRLFGRLQKLNDFFIDFANHKGIATIAIIAVKHSNEVKSYNIAIFKHIIRRETMSNLIVHFNA